MKFFKFLKYKKWIWKVFVKSDLNFILNWIAIKLWNDKIYSIFFSRGHIFISIFIFKLNPSKWASFFLYKFNNNIVY